MQTQILNLTLSEQYHYGDWVRHLGVETAHNRFALWLVHGGYVWLHSDIPAGKTHFLHAMAAEHPCIGLIRVLPHTRGHRLALVDQWMAALREKAFWAVDIVSGTLPHIHALALFHLLERAREMRRPLLLAWGNQNMAMLPPELVSRLNAMEQIGMVSPHTDEALTAVLMSVASARQWHVNQALIDWLLKRCPREMSTLIANLQDMENASLQAHKHLTLAWAKKYMARHNVPRLPLDYPR